LFVVVVCCLELVEDCQGVGEESLKFLSILKQEKPGSGKIAAGANDLQTSIRGLQRKANVRTSGAWCVAGCV
jgi:hypothetical protein